MKFVRNDLIKKAIKETKYAMLIRNIQKNATFHILVLYRFNAPHMF